MRGVFITANDTGAGKTWVGQHLIQQLMRDHKLNVIPRKPVESGWPENEEESDAWNLAKAAGMTTNLHAICPNRFKAPISPQRAALLENKTVSLETLVQQCTAGISDEDFLLVEGAGGFYSPICDSSLNADLATRLGLPVLLAIENRLGAINQALLCIEAIQQSGLKLSAVVLNAVAISQSDKSNEIQLNNFEDLANLTETPLFSIEYNDDVSVVFSQLSKYLIES